jgi:IMP cyclohydrolase
MDNPGGLYPGRQLFVGMTLDKRPALAYLVTGRSPPSRARRVILQENKAIIRPTGEQPYDPLRHYTAVEFDNGIGLAVVSNGIQTEAIFETYRLLFHTGSSPTEDYAGKLLDGAGAEPDSLNTPRIAGVVTSAEQAAPACILGIKRHHMPAKVFKIWPEPGVLMGLSTYNGSLKNPKPFNPDSGLLRLEFKGGTPEELAEYLFDISSASYQRDDIRVCSIGGMRFGDGDRWTLAIRNLLK